MKKSSMEAIVSAGQDLDRVKIEGREDYSGRSMYGKSTAAVVVENIGDLLAAVAYAGALAGAGELGEIPQSSLDLVEDLQRVSMDSMGRGIVVY